MLDRCNDGDALSLRSRQGDRTWLVAAAARASSFETALTRLLWMRLIDFSAC